jgi:hypothetical protein
MPSTQPTLNLPTKFSKGGMFGSGYSFGQALSDGLNGYLAGMGNPVGQANIAAIHQRRMMEQQQALAAQQYARERQDKRDDFTFEQDYRAQHPGPINNDTVNDYQFIAQTLGPEAAKQFLQTKTNPIVMTPVGPMPYSSVMGAGGGATTPKPLTDDDILKMGGTSGNAGGGFPY